MANWSHVENGKITQIQVDLRPARPGLLTDPLQCQTARVSIDLEPVRGIVAKENGLASVAVVRADGTPRTSLVNAGVVDHPRTAEPVVGYVTYGGKLRNLRERPATSMLWRAGWQWAGVEGRAS